MSEYIISEDMIDYVNSLRFIDDKYREFASWNYYKYKDTGVPRVSNILDSCIGKQYLCNWAASLGSLDAYKAAKFAALDTGSLAHEMVENYLMDGAPTIDFNKVGRYANIEQAQCAYSNYRSFETDLLNKGFSIDSLMLELECIGPLYGGTIDFVANINNINTLESKMYILDFKTSNKISMEYLIQTMLYVMNIEYLKSLGDQFYSAFDIKGIGIIRIDKNKLNTYQYLLVDFDKDKQFVDQIIKMAKEIVLYYYSLKNYESSYRINYKSLIDKEELF